MLDKIKSFEAKSERNKRINYYIVYTVVFLVTASLVYLQFHENGKGFIYNGDGLAQHFPVLTYFAKILRQSIFGMFSGNGLQLPLWDFAIGPGADIITTLNYYGIGDPLCLLTIFFPLTKMEWGYAFLVLLRIYLAGVTFSAYCKEMGKDRWSTLCGALAYIFCGYTIYAGVRHPFFLNPMIILPLLLLGVEKIFKGRKPYVFILAVFYAAITGVYFFYMLGIMVGIYVLIRCWSFYEENKIKGLLKLIGKLVGYTVIGILLSGVVFIPNIIALLGSTRMQANIAIDAFFAPEYYFYAPMKFLSGTQVGDWTFLGYVALVLIAILMMFSYRRKYTQLKVGFVILTIMLCLPYAGHVMNGFSYVSNRWIWGYSFLLAFIMVTMLPKMIDIGTGRFIALLLVSVAYLSYIGLILLDERSTKGILKASQLAMVQYCIVMGVLVLVFVWLRFAKKKETKILAKAHIIVVKVVLLATVVICTFLRANWFFSSQGGNYISIFGSMDTAYQRQTEVANVVNLINDTEEFYRYGENVYNKGQLINSALISQVHGHSLYYSIVDENYLEYLTEVACNDVVDTRKIEGLDSRTGLHTLGSTKYYVTEVNKESYVPYGYEKQFENGRFSIYKNEYYLPLGYTYNRYISRAKYEALNAIQREQAMLQGVVLDGKSENLLEIEPQIEIAKCDFEITCGEGVVLENEKFVVDKKGAEAVIKIKGLPDSETYLWMSSVQYQAPKGMEEKITRTVVEVIDAAKAQAVKKILDIRTPYHQWFIKRQETVLNMGYANHAKNMLTLKFTEKGEYTFGEMSIICQPMDKYDEQTSKLKEEVLENVVIGTNKVNGTLDLKDTKFLCMSIPYSKGWSVYVDGEKRELFRANTAYMGIELEAGHHEIELKYFTPYLKISIVCTIVGMMIFAGIVIVDKRKGIYKGKNRE